MNIFKLFLKASLTPVFLIAIVLSGTLLYFNIVEASNIFHETIHAHEIMTTINACQARMYEADALFLRFAISKEKKYLELYYRDVNDSEMSIRKLTKLTENNPSHQANCKILKEGFDKRELGRRKSVDANDLEGMKIFAVSEENNNIHRSIANVMSDMGCEEHHLAQEQEGYFYRSVGIIIVLFAFVIALIMGLFGFISGQFHAQNNILSDFLAGSGK